MAEDNGKNDNKEFQVVTSALDDCRRLIAAGKVQRRDVVKWGVTVNIALGAAAPALGHNFSLFGFAVAVAIVSLLLVGHYNSRISGARETATTLTKRLKSSFNIDYDAITKAEPARTNGWFWRYLSSLKPSALKPALSYSAGEYYDWQELWIFSAILAVSPFLVLLVLAAH